MRPIPRLAFAAWLLAAPALAGEAAYTPPRPPGAGRVLVYRGGSADVPSAIPVHRGSAAPPGYLTAVPPPRPVLPVGGRNIWFVDPAEGGLAACNLVNTYTVGVTAIQCTDRRLPID